MRQRRENRAASPRAVARRSARGARSAAGDIGYWAPGGDFVLYYDNDAPYFDGIVVSHLAQALALEHVRDRRPVEDRLPGGQR